MLVCMSGWPVVAQAQHAEPRQQRVFKTERSKSSKVVQYDVQ